MKLDHLSDNELIEYIIKHDNDPIRFRLATIMERMPGAIIDSLERAGMDDTYCTFRSIVTETEYEPGEYISHLENEVRYLQDKLDQERKEVKNLQARTVMELIAELKQEIKTAEFKAEQARVDRDIARQDKDVMKNKLDMWAILNR